MFDRFKRDPVKRARRHIEKALVELEDDYPEYASVEYEKAARLFLEAEETDFAVKYFRESAYCALHKEDHTRSAEMKIAAAEVLLMDNRYGASSSLYSEASDHQFRMKRVRDSTRSMGLSILGSLAARQFDTAVNLLKKAEKRLQEKDLERVKMLNYARLCIEILVDGKERTEKEVEKAINSVKCKEFENGLVRFVGQSIQLALQTEVKLEWAGKTPESVSAKSQLEFELRYTCPVPVRVTEYRYNASNGLRMLEEPEFSQSETTNESWLLQVVPDLSGDGVLGPFRLTLEGTEVLVHKPSNTIRFRIDRAPSDLEMDLTPRMVSCSLGDEAVFDVILSNKGDGSADDVKITIETSDGLQVSLGGSEKTIQFIGSGESMRIQVYVKPVVSVGDELVRVKVMDSRSGTEMEMASEVKVG